MDVSQLLRNITFRQLEIFTTVAEHGSFSKAAEAIHLTQPSVSMQVKKLAETVGYPLFEQIGKKVFLTQAGKLLYTSTLSIFEELRKTQMTLSDLAGLKQGRMRLGAVSTAEYFAPRVLGAFNRAFPDIDVELVVFNRRVALSRISKNTDDLYILGQPPKGLDVESRPFLSNPHIALAHSNHPLAEKKEISLQEFAALPMIVREQGSGTRIAMERFFAESGLTMKIKMELGSAEAIKQAVAGGLGVTMLSVHSLSFVGGSSQLTMLKVKGLPLKRQWHLAHPKGKELTPAAAAFQEFMLSRGPSLVQPGLEWFKTMDESLYKEHFMSQEQ